MKIIFCILLLAASCCAQERKTIEVDRAEAVSWLSGTCVPPILEIGSGPTVKIIIGERASAKEFTRALVIGLGMVPPVDAQPFEEQIPRGWGDLQDDITEGESRSHPPFERQRLIGFRVRTVVFCQ